MDAKFSPGPWCVVKTAGRYSIIRQDGEPVAVIPFSDAKGAMDAALISKTPNLFEALSDLICAINKTYFDDVQMEVLEPRLKAAVGVIEEINREV